MSDLLDGLENELVDDTLEELKTKKYVFGKKISEAYPEDIADEIENYFFLCQESTPITITVSKDIDNYHLVFEIKPVIK